MQRITRGYLMTDGIIQEVFKKYFNNHRTYRDLNEPRRKDLIDINELKTIERELIEKIKQNWREINKTHAMCSCNADIEIFEMLIGDNQE